MLEGDARVGIGDEVDRLHESSGTRSVEGDVEALHPVDERVL